MDINSTLPLRTGREIPTLGFGTWELNDEPTDAVASALELGYRMLDTSGDYGTQPAVGDGIRRSGLQREQLYVITKVELEDDAYEATQRNLAEMDLDYADLMLIHRPPKDGVGEDLWQGLIRARDERLTRDIGVSNYSVEQLRQLIDASGEVPAVNQIEWTPFGWSEEMVAFCREHDILIQAYSPLTRGERLADAALREIAASYEKTPAQVLLRWNLQRGVVPIPKANQPEHQSENLDVFDFALGAEDMQQLDGLNTHASSLGEKLQYV